MAAWRQVRATVLNTTSSRRQCSHSSWFNNHALLLLLLLPTTDSGCTTLCLLRLTRLPSRLCIRSRSDLFFPIRSDAFRSGPWPRQRSAAYSFPITHQKQHHEPSNTSPTKTFDSYTWPDSVAPSPYFPKVEKAVPVSDRVLRSHVANKLVAKLSFD